MRAKLALGWLGLLGVAALWPGLSARAAYEPAQPLLLAAPSLAHWLGTDDRGRDVLVRMLAGARPLLAIALVAALLYVVVGALLGVGGALWRGLGLVGDRLTELGLVLPVVYLLLAVRAILGPPDALLLGAALGLLYGPHAARLCRAESERVLASSYVEAARAVGVPPLRLGLVHVLPTAIRPALGLALLAAGQAALFEGALGAIGLGLPPPQATWGELLQQAAAQPKCWWLWAAPSLAIALSVLATQTLAASRGARA